MKRHSSNNLLWYKIKQSINILYAIQVELEDGNIEKVNELLEKNIVLLKDIAEGIPYKALPEITT